jgi:hypothetical protein
MIPQDVLNTIRNGICSVGFITVPPEEFRPSTEDPVLNVIGTGFIVHSGIVMTCKHVLEGLLEYQGEMGFADNQRIAMFVRADNSGNWRAFASEIQWLSFPKTSDFDVGFIGYNSPDDPAVANPAPLTIAANKKYTVTESIAICGYPYGHQMLQRNEKVYRWGPVVQQGYISAVSPYDSAASVDELLLDIRIAGGMSGAPLFRITDGAVIGMVHSTWEATTALALPLTEKIVAGWVKQQLERLDNSTA